MAIKNVLVVDDSATDRHLLTEMLKKHGYTVSTASNGEEAITKAFQLLDHRRSLPWAKT